MPTGTGIAWLADVPDREPGHGPPQLVIRRKHPVIAMPVLPRRRDEIGVLAASGTPAAAHNSLSTSSRKILVSAATARGRSASMPRNR
jgi:hypothetical protein